MMIIMLLLNFPPRIIRRRERSKNRGEDKKGEKRFLGSWE